MPLNNVNQYGASYSFGFQSSDAPSISGFFARSAELRYEAEVFAQAQDGEGMTESIVTTKPNLRKIVGTFTGYLQDGFDPGGISATFGFAGGRTFIVKNVSQAKRKGEFNEVTIEAESYGLIH